MNHLRYFLVASTALVIQATLLKVDILQLTAVFLAMAAVDYCFAERGRTVSKNKDSSTPTIGQNYQRAEKKQAATKQTEEDGAEKRDAENSVMKPGSLTDCDYSCWVCCESEPQGLLHSTGCGCRGSTGLAHISCLVEAALHNMDSWTSCPMCKQDFTGECEIGLARARWERVRDRPAEDGERLFVANNLAVTLQQAAGDFEGAFKLLAEVLAVHRRMLGNEHPETIDAITNLALHHSEMGNMEAALVLSEEAVTLTRKTHGMEHEEAGHALISLAAVHSLMQNYELAKPLHLEALKMRRRLLGSEHLDTMNSMFGLGEWVPSAVIDPDPYKC
jgi:hypothetical protein